MDASINSIQINGIDYIPADSVTGQLPTGDRHVVVVDRGWIWAGNVTVDEVGQVLITDAIHVFSWESIGFTGVLKDPKSPKVKLMDCPYPVVVPKASVIFMIPVSQDWGK